MKNLNLLMGLGFAAISMTAQAQTTVVNLGFENGDTKYTTAGAYTPGGTYGDWINRNDEDVWNEQFTDDVHSGEFAFQMLNSDVLAGNTWDRGFKVGNLQLKENTAYRVSFWVKADGGNNLKSTLSIGKEYFDMPISTKSGQQYYNTFVSPGYDWKHYSYITFFTNKADQDALSEDYTGKVDVNGDTVSYKGEPFPDEYFITINMYNPGEYILDDIKLEEGVTFREATFLYETIKLDFGYPTNIADLAKANGGTFSLDPAQVSVTVNGEPAAVEFLEGQSDGFLYIFLAEASPEEGDEVIVSFTPAEDCPIVYNGDKRPSADVESELPVFGFTAETAYFDETIDALPAAWSPATLVSTDPENNSFELDANTVKSVSFTFNKAMSIDMTSATIAWSDNFGSYTEDLPDITLSDDEMTITVNLTDALADGEYEVTLSGITNSYGVDCEDAVVSFEVGEDQVGGTSEDIYVSDFDNGLTDGIPQGWLTKDATGVHQYGFMDEAQTIQYQYGWGQADRNPNGTQGGARLYQGFSGDFQKALYWCAREDGVGYTSYGEIVKDWLNPDGSIQEGAPEGIALVLEPRKYQISFTMAAWKGEPKFQFTLEDLEGNVYAKFMDYVAKPNMNGQQGEVKGSLKCTTDFTVPAKGYYILKFTAQGEWQEFLLGKVSLITMPSKSAYYKQQLAAALETAKAIMDTAGGDEYNGDTKSAFAAAIYSAENDHFTSPSQVEALIDELDRLGQAMAKRVENIDNFTIALIEAMEAYYQLEGKYAKSEYAIEAKEMIDTYEYVDPSNLSDEELNEVTPKLMNASALMVNVPNVVDVLTWRAYKASQTAETLLVESNIKNDVLNLATDDDAVIAACNEASKQALYKLIVNDGITEEMKTTVNYDMGQYIEKDGIYVEAVGEEEEFHVATSGIDFTCLIKNPKFYTYATNFSANLQDNTVVGWNCQQYEGGSAHLSGTAATESNPVVNSIVNAYGGGAEYKFYQVIENAPVGVYDVYIASRTATKNNQPDPEGNEGVFNAQNDSTGIWDKYIYAQVDDEDPIMIPFSAGPSWSGHPTVIPNVAVGEGQKLTIGVVEHYVSGKASDHNYTATNSWDTNTFATDARLYFVAPLEGFDYSAAGRVTTADITNLIDQYLDGVEGITVETITNLIDKYLNQ
jgi:hypothetical protein